MRGELGLGLKIYEGVASLQAAALLNILIHLCDVVDVLSDKVLIFRLVASGRLLPLLTLLQENFDLGQGTLCLRANIFAFEN